MEKRETSGQYRYTPSQEPEAQLPPPPKESYENEISLLELGAIFLRHRWLVLGTPVILAFLVIVHSLVFTSRTWTTTAAFTPQSDQQSSTRLRGLASQLGVSIPAGEAAQSPEFYVDLINSRDFLARVARSRYTNLSGDSGKSSLEDRVPGSSTRKSRDSITLPGPPSISQSRLEGAGSASFSSGISLIEAYGIESENRRRAIDAAVRRLKSSVSTETDFESGLVRVSVSMHKPELAGAVGARIIEMVNIFNLEFRQSQASSQRRFLEERVHQAREDLVAAEDSLKRFLENNRRYEGSPQLVFEYQRLQRRVDLQQQIYTSLSQSLEEAKIEAVRNTPVITVVQEAEVPIQPDSRRTILKGVIALFLGGMLSVSLAFGFEYVKSASQEEPEKYRELSALMRQTVDDLVRPWHWIRKTWRSEKQS